MPTRRELFALAAALPLGWSGPTTDWTLAPVPDEQVVLTERRGSTRVRLPAPGSRCVASFDVAGTPCAAVSFVTRTCRDEPIELLVVAGGGRVLALEPWAGRTATGGHFATRLDLWAPERGLILRRDAALPRADRSVWQRQSWIDLLQAGGAGLIDAPSRPPQPASWQAGVAARRGIVMARLARPTEAVGDELAACAAAWPWTPQAPTQQAPTQQAPTQQAPTQQAG